MNNHATDTLRAELGRLRYELFKTEQHNDSYFIAEAETAGIDFRKETNYLEEKIKHVEKAIFVLDVKTNENP